MSIGIIGSADGPTSIYVATVLGSKYAPAIVVAAYSYMALVPIIQPPIMRALTTTPSGGCGCPSGRARSRAARKILFPVVTILVTGLIAPKATPLIGTLMFGNLLRESRRARAPLAARPRTSWRTSSRSCSASPWAA